MNISRQGIMVLGVAMAAGCGVTRPPGSDDGSTTDVMLDGESSGPWDSSTSASDSTGSSGSSTHTASTEASSSTGEPLDECPLRTLELPFGWRIIVEGEPVYELTTTQSQCTFVQQMPVPVEPGTVELELSCVPTDAPLPAELVLRFYFELAPLPFEPGAELELSAIREPDGAINRQVLLTLREPGGELLLAAFEGYDPTGKGPESEGFFAPVSLELVDGLCPDREPCENFGCIARAAIDVGVDGGEPVRVYDGNVATVGESPSYQAYVAQADVGVTGLDDPGARVDVVVTRLP